jgi:hypothetical protein
MLPVEGKNPPIRENMNMPRANIAARMTSTPRRTVIRSPRTQKTRFGFQTDQLPMRPRCQAPQQEGMSANGDL